MNPAAGYFQDCNGIRISDHNTGTGYYPLNWLLHKDTLISPREKEAFDQLDNDEDRDKFWSNLCIVDAIGGVGTILPEVDSVWQINFRSDAVTVRGVHVDDSVGPLIAPHLPGHYTEDRPRAYRNLLKKSKTNQAGNRRYVRGAFYFPKNISSFELESSSPLVWDPATSGELDIQLWVMQQRELSSEIKCPGYPYTTSTISVRQINSQTDGSILDQCNSLGKYHEQSGLKSNRSGDKGSMYAVGRHVPQGDSNIVTAKTGRNFNATLCSDLCKGAAKLFKRIFPLVCGCGGSQADLRSVAG